MPTIYNPRGLKSNCGFCSIARALHVQGHTFVNADTLYDQTLKRLGIRAEGGRDPIPRMLIFPEHDLDSIRVSAEYDALKDGPHGLSSYTINSVAEANRLRFAANSSNPELPRQFIQFCANTGHGRWSLKDFAEFRMDWLTDKGLKPKLEAVRRHVAEELQGHSIIGSKTGNHFINVEIDPLGSVTATDAQDGALYDGKGLYSRLGTVDLFMHLRG